MLKKMCSGALALLLALILAAQLPLQAIAASIPKYLKEIRMATAASKREAADLLEEEGYTVLDCDFYEGTGSTVCYMGYKTTTDPEEAITDIRLMNAGGGISEKKYRDLVAGWKSGITASAGYLKEACLEVKANYEKGSPLAAAAVTLLDLFEADGVSLSDYLFDTARTDEEYQDILLICADNVVATVYNALNLGTADYQTASFAERLVKTDSSLFDYDYIAQQKENPTYTAYWAAAVRVTEQLQSFTAAYDEAVEFFEDYRETQDTTGTAAETPTEEERNAYWKQFVDEQYENSTSEEEQALYQYAVVMGIYEKLSKYASFSSSYENLAAYIYACGDPLDENWEETDRVTYRMYPLVASLTAGQLFTLQYGGVSALVASLEENTQTYADQAAAAAGALKEKISENGLERISIFYNVNRDIYNQSVSFTEEAVRVATSSAAYDSLTKTQETDQVTKNLTNIVLIGGMVAGSILAVTVLAMGIAAAIFHTTAMTLIGVGYLAMLSGSIAVAMGGMTLTTGALVAGIVGMATVVLAIIVVAIVLICVLIAFFRSLFAKDEEEVTYPDKTDLLYDVVGTEFTEYRAVCGNDGTPADLTNGGAQWDCLYYTRSTNAGAPIKADSGAFLTATDSYVPPEGYMAVRRFGFVSTANLNTYKKNASHPRYLFYCSEESEQETGNTYLYDLQLMTGDTAEAVLLALQDKKYTVIEENLTPKTGKVTYLGYTTTDNPNKAITDIRVAYCYSANKMYFGTTAAGAAAEYACFGTLGTQASLYYVKQRSNGSPILADLKVTATRLDADSGYEPVNLFSGGDAFNLLIGSQEEDGIRVMKEGLWDEALYLYFRPTETFSSSGTEYISGFAFSSGFKDNLDFAASCGFRVVESLEGYDLTSGLTENPTYLLYSTTYNPYRAITEIKTYTTQNAAASTFENIVMGTTAYAACETFACIRDIGVFTTDYYRLLRPSNAFISRNSYEGGYAYSVSSRYQAINNFGKYEEIPTKGLYVAGPDPDAKPLTMPDVCFCTDSETAGRTAFENANGETVYCKPVADVTDCYATVAENLTFEWDCNSRTVLQIPEYYVKEITFDHYLRIFYRGSVAEKGKYVSSISVVTVDPDDGEEAYAADQAIMQLLAKGEGEILKINLAKSKSNQPYSTETVTSGDTSYTRGVYKAVSGKASYVLVQYTDTRIESMRTATEKWFGEGETASATMEYQNTQFERAGDTVSGLSGTYGIYISRNGQLGSAITEVILDSEYLQNGCTTVTDCDGGCHLGEDYILKFRHGADGACDIYYTDLKVVSCSSRGAALAELYRQGCDGFVDQDKNNGSGGSCVYVGYKTTASADAEGVITGVQIQLRSDADAPYTYEGTEGTYERISDNLNNGIGGQYAYLYITRSSQANPITKLSTSTYMASTLSLYADYRANRWTTTENASEGTKADTYKLCYRQQSNDWAISEDGVLYIYTEGAMADYTDRLRIFYTRPGAVGGRLTSVTSYPEWSEYGDAITAVSVSKTVTAIDDCAFRNCPNIEHITFFNRDCVIPEDSIPETAALRGVSGSTADDYAARYGLVFTELPYLSGTLLGNRRFVVIPVVAVVLLGTGAAVLVISRSKRKKVRTGGTDQ